MSWWWTTVFMLIKLIYQHTDNLINNIAALCRVCGFAASFSAFQTTVRIVCIPRMGSKLPNNPANPTPDPSGRIVHTWETVDADYHHYCRTRSAVFALGLQKLKHRYQFQGTVITEINNWRCYEHVRADVVDLKWCSIYIDMSIFP